MSLCLFQVYNVLLYMFYLTWAFQQPCWFYHHFIGEETGSKRNKVPAYRTHRIWLQLTLSPLETQAIITAETNQDDLDGTLEPRL